MFQELLIQANRQLPLFGMLLFVFVFVGVIFRTYGRKAEAYSALERMPLDDDAPEGNQTRSPHVADAEGGRRG